MAVFETGSSLCPMNIWSSVSSASHPGFRSPRSLKRFGCKWLPLALSALSASLIATIGGTQSAIAAEQIIFHYGLLEFDLDVADLETYAATGEVSDSLAFFLHRIDPDEAWLRMTLQKPYQFSDDPTQNLIELDRLLTSAQGEAFLRQLGDVIQPESRQTSGFHALRAAILSAAAEGEGVTVLNVLHQFPSPSIMIDAQQAPATMAYLQQVQRIGFAFNLPTDVAITDVKKEPQTAADQLIQTAFLNWLRYDDQQAKDDLAQSLAIRRETGDRMGEGITLLAIGLLGDIDGHYPDAIANTQAALTIFQALDFPAGEGLALSTIAYAYMAQGDYAQALDHYEQSLTTYQRPDGQPRRAFAADDLIEAFLPTSGTFSPIAVVEEIHQTIGEPITLSQMGQVYRSVGQLDQALDVLQQARSIHHELGFFSQEAVTLHGIGKVYQLQGDYEQALDYFEAAHQLSQTVEEEASQLIEQLVGSASADFGFPAPGEGSPLWSMAQVRVMQGEYDEALDFFQQVLDWTRANDSPHAEAGALHSMANVYAKQGRYSEAFDAYQQAIAIYQTQGIREEQGNALAGMGSVLEQQDQPELAIIFYKQAINLFESIRASNQELPTNLQQSYTETIADVYRHLADLLLQRDRVLEAQQVLDLLKVQELDDYLQDIRGSQEQLEYWQPEQRILKLYNQAIEAGRELDKLRALERTRPLTPAEDQRRRELVELEGEILSSFDQFINRPEVVDAVDQLTRTAQQQNLALEDLNALQDNLRNLDQNAVLLYPLMLEDRLELVLVTPYAPPIRRPVSVSRQELNTAILAFRQTLENPDSNPLPPAQQLYQWLIEPLEADLAEANAETIIYAPDAQLRYIPLAALHDGNQWLAQRFRINHITAASLTDFDTPPRPELRVLAGAFTHGEYQVAVDNRQFEFVGLPYAEIEVANLAEAIPQTTSLFDQDFSPEATVPRMDSYTVIHLATHAAFMLGDPNESFILFGNGERVTLRDIRRWNLPNVDLVVLSACETGIGGSLGNGEEILGFGYQMQRTGARSAIASLWKVSDGGTQILMNAFYEHLRQGNSKAEALRQAQQAFIADRSTLIAQLQRNIAVEYPEQEADLAALDRNRLQHPYYWAPFILIGNGL